MPCQPSGSLGCSEICTGNHVPSEVRGRKLGVLNYLILPQEIGFLPALRIPDTSQYFIVAFYAVKSFLLSPYAHMCRKKSAVHRV